MQVWYIGSAIGFHPINDSSILFTCSTGFKELNMNKIEKQKQKLQDRIEQLENEMQMSLQKKTQGKAFDVPKCLQEISKLKEQISKL